MTSIPAQCDGFKRDAQLGELLNHCERIPDPQEVFRLLDLLRRMDAIDSEEAADLMSLYWEAA